MHRRRLCSSKRPQRHFLRKRETSTTIHRFCHVCRATSRDKIIQTHMILNLSLIRCRSSRSYFTGNVERRRKYQTAFEKLRRTLLEKTEDSASKESFDDSIDFFEAVFVGIDAKRRVVCLPNDPESIDSASRVSGKELS